MAMKQITRRRFLSNSAVAGAGIATLAAAPSAALGRASRNDTLRVAIVGPGGRGQSLMREFFEFAKQYNAQMTGVCDVWTRRRDEAIELVKEAHGAAPKVYRRLDDVLADKDIDAVIIGTADHQHAKMLQASVEAGKDVYVEKPMANVLEEANAAFAAVQRSDAIVQIGTQRRSWPKYRAAEKMLKSTPLGDIVRVEIIGNACSPYRWRRSDADITAAREKDVDWQGFLMGKPDRPYDPRIFRCFRLFREFSGGIVDQWMSHAIDAVHMLTGESHPNSAVAHGGIYKYHDFRENADTISVAFEYGKGAKKFLVTYDVCLINASGRGCRLMGTRGTLHYENAGWRFSGNDVTFDDRISTDVEVQDDPDAMHHMANWLDCVRRRDPSSLYCDAAAGYGHSVACVLATESYWTGRRLEFNPQTKELASV